MKHKLTQYLISQKLDLSQNSKDKAPTEAHGLFDALSKQFGKMPNMFGLMAHRPDVLRKFLPFYSAVMEGGTVEHRYKELAYLKTSLINACEY